MAQTLVPGSERIAPADLESFDKAGYLEICSTIGRQITWLPEGAGRAVGISADGALVVATAAGQETLRSGAVHHVRAATMPPDVGHL